MPIRINRGSSRMQRIRRRAVAAVPVLATVMLAAATTAGASTTVRATAAPGHRPAAASPGQLTTYGYDNARDGHDTREPSFAHLKAAWSDGDNVISGGIYGEPLVDGKLVIVANENDRVYGLSAATGKVAWSYTVGTPARLSTVDSAPTLNSSCGDIDPLGITGTPVIDPVPGELYVAAEVQTGSTTSPTWEGIQHVMVALKFTPTSVSLAWKHQIDPPGAGTTYYIPAEQQRSALTLANGHVYAEYGGLNGDCGSYQGYVVAMAASGTGALESWPVPTVREGAIWATDGAATGPGGELFVAT